MQNKNLLKQMQQMQARMAKAQEELAAKSVVGTAGGGAVSVTASGDQQILEVAIDPEVMDDHEMLQDLVKAACNAALDSSRAMAAQDMSQVLPGGLPPGLF